MNVEIGTAAAQFLFWEYINPNFYAVHGVVHHVNTGSAAQCLPAPGGWTLKITPFPKESSSPSKKKDPGHPSYNLSLRRKASGAPVATTAISTPSQYWTGTLCPTYSHSMTEWLAAFCQISPFLKLTTRFPLAITPTDKDKH
jgi:hypothetical protein